MVHVLCVHLSTRACVCVHASKLFSNEKPLLSFEFRNILLPPVIFSAEITKFNKSIPITNYLKYISAVNNFICFDLQTFWYREHSNKGFEDT